MSSHPVARRPRAQSSDSRRMQCGRGPLPLRVHVLLESARGPHARGVRARANATRRRGLAARRSRRLPHGPRRLRCAHARRGPSPRAPRASPTTRHGGAERVRADRCSYWRYGEGALDVRVHRIPTGFGLIVSCSITRIYTVLK